MISSYAMGWYACERPDGWLYQHDGVVSGFMASNAIGRRNDRSWSEVTVLANKDATVEIVRLRPAGNISCWIRAPSASSAITATYPP
jgi:hypothetical protein